MLSRSFLVISFLFSAVITSWAQTACSALGQDPGTAFPVCGTALFGQTTVPICGGTPVPTVTQCTSPAIVYTDKNPYWYRFTCFDGGSFAFSITPNIQQEDYDWQLYDITGRVPTDVYTDPSLIVGCNWSGEFGTTGTSQNGGSLFYCDGLGVPLLSAMPTLIKGHNYLLLVSHFSDSQSGYSLTFGGNGGTAVITDTTAPHLKSVSVPCDNEHINIKLNKKMKCSSIATDGSNFSINIPGYTVIAASSDQCNNGFDMDSLMITIDKPLQAGNYKLTIKKASDSSSISDNCNNGIPEGESISLTALIPRPAKLDSVAPLGCAPDLIQILFKTAVRCNTIEPNGSDFIITGNSPVTINSATANCNNGLANIIQLHLDAPIKTKGNFTIKAKIGDDGNTITNECGQETPIGSSVNFSTVDTVSAEFSYNIIFGCQTDTVHYFHDGAGGVNSWKWRFDNKGSSILPDPVVPYYVFSDRTAALTVSNGVCTDTASEVIPLNNELKASFESTDILCPNDQATFKDNSIGTIITWTWDLGNGNISTAKQPPSQTYPVPNNAINVPVSLKVTNNIGCTDSVTQYLQVVNNCYIAIPSAFTPNRDGLNDYLYPLNGYKTTALSFKVFNRVGQLVFETNNWQDKWDGTFKGQPAAAGTYVWVLQYTDTDTNQSHFSKGTSVLIR